MEHHYEYFIFIILIPDDYKFLYNYSMFYKFCIIFMNFTMTTHRQIDLESGYFQPKSDCNYSFSIDLGILFGAKSIGIG